MWKRKLGRVASLTAMATRLHQHNYANATKVVHAKFYISAQIILLQTLVSEKRKKKKLVG